MYLQALASAFPENRYTQPEIWELLSASPRIKSLSRRGAKIMETVLMGNSGIETRHFALPPEKIFSLDAQGLNEAFEAEAPRLGGRALAKACEKAGITPQELDAVFVCTCTGYLCPGLSSYVGEQMKLRPEAVLHDLSGLGCGAAIPTMQAAQGFLAAQPDAVVATLAIETCSTAFYINDDAGVLVSACLFGDGSSASIWRGQGQPDQWKAGHFRSLHVPEQREKIRFVNRGGYLCNQLHRDVPAVAAEAVDQIFAWRTADPAALIAHSGGRDVIDAIEAKIPQYTLNETREGLRKYGNLSSPSVMVALEDRLGQNNPNDKLLWLTGFGAGFAAHSCELSRA
jgi:predicted naringenin-chalcone synthase